MATEKEKIKDEILKGEPTATLHYDLNREVLRNCFCDKLPQNNNGLGLVTACDHHSRLSWFEQTVDLTTKKTAEKIFEKIQKLFDDEEAIGNRYDVLEDEIIRFHKEFE